MILWVLTLAGWAHAGEFTQVCSFNLATTAQMFEAAEKPESKGQIQFCLPASGPEKTTEVIARRLLNLARENQASYSKYLDLEKETKELSHTVTTTAGNICGASPEVKEEVNDLQAEVKTVAAQLAAQVKEGRELYQTFRAEYLLRTPTIGSLLPNIVRDRRCHETDQSLRTIAERFINSVDSCKYSAESAGIAGKSLNELSTALAAGCK